MQRLTEETVLAVGRLTLAAAELEYVLARVAADQGGDDPARLFAVPGAPLLAARDSVRFASAEHHNEFSRLLDSAELYLTQSHRADEFCAQSLSTWLTTGEHDVQEPPTV
jgi:hypothetical protein